ncbi:chromosome condensation protein CrcB [Ligilactobacillus saerimneri]|uniref:Fluoride-specific ion channel FluC n=1 Tax=Ligilactobacillus saerimneri TaxID=228229 RepID=A0A7H9ELE2_9LACO|nr:CrcB family protein [Ligilactobacillus saerimneri]QLL78548.1 chromosome condensation protein CrcB [Ligilactobacillus saerimneri]
MKIKKSQIIGNTLSIMICAMLGGSLRYWLSQVISLWPMLGINLSGCLILGGLTFYWLERKPLAEWITVGLGTGLLGAFTSFSSFTLDVVKMTSPGLVWGYVLLGIGGGLLATASGCYIGHYLGTREVRR